MGREHMTYTEGWHDGYKAHRDDLLEKLTEIADSSEDETFNIEWLITMLENGEL